jgi:hypothetical protein
VGEAKDSEVFGSAHLSANAATDDDDDSNDDDKRGADDND